MTEPETSSEVPLRLYETEVRPEWVDYNGHMSEAFYVLVFGYTTDALLDLIGMDPAYRERTKYSMYTLEAHVCYLQEIAASQPLYVTTQLLDVDNKRLHVYHAMYEARSDDLLATGELMLLNVDSAVPQATPFPEGIATRLQVIRKAHEALPPPKRAGRSIAIKHGTRDRLG